MAVSKIDTFTVSADSQSDKFGAQLTSSPFQTWLWEVTMTGSGANEVYITPQIPALVEEPDDTQIYHDIDSMVSFRWMRLVTDEMVTAAGGTYKEQFICPNAINEMRFDFDYEGAGSRVFTIVVRAG